MAATCTQSCYSDVQRLLNDLNSNSNYSPEIFPNRGNNTYLIINVYFFIIKLLQLTNSGTFNVVGTLNLVWDDPRLTWNPSNYNGVYSVDVPSAKIWTPRLNLINAVSQSMAIELDDSSISTVFSNGHVALRIARVFYATCPINLQSFPFDSQKCTLIIGNMDLSSKSTELMFLYPGAFVVNTEAYSAGGEFSLVATNVSFGWFIIKQLNIIYPIVNISFQFSRNPSYYLTNVAVPSLMLLFSSSLIFLLPSENNVKIIMACSLMVALYFLQQAVSRIIPTTPTVPRLATGIMIELGLGCYSVLCAVLTVALRTLQPRLCPCCVKLIKAVERVFYEAPSKTKVRDPDIIELLPSETHSKMVFEDNENDAPHRLAVALGTLASTLSMLKEREESQQLELNEKSRHWRIIDAILNATLFCIYIVIATVSCILFLFDSV